MDRGRRDVSAGQAAAVAAVPESGPVVTELLRHLLTAAAPEAAATYAVTAVRDATGADVSWCGLLHDTMLTMAAHSGLRTVRMANEWTLPLGVGVGGRVAADGRPLSVRDYRHDPRRAPTQKTMIDEEGIRAAMCAPLTSNGQVLGVIYAARRQPYDWTPSEVALLTELADDCGAAIGRLRRRSGILGTDAEDDQSQLDAVLGLQADLAEVLAASGDLAAGLTVLTRRLGLTADLVGPEGHSLLGLEPTAEPVRCRVPLPGSTGERLEIAGGRDLTVEELAAVRAAATVFGMQLRVGRAGAAAQRRAARDLLDALIGGGGDPRMLRSDAALLGLDLRQHHFVVCVGARRPRGRAGPDAAPLSGATVEHLERATATAYPGSLAVPRDGDLVLLIPARTGGRPQERIRDLIRFHSLPAEGMAAGIGRRCANPRDFPESYGEAALALDLARRQAEPGAVFTAGDLGLSGLLAASGSSRKTLEALVDGSLGPLLRSDRDDGTQYVRTLRAWLAKDRHLERSAEVLHVHPNTVRYRLGRAQELLELDLRDVDDRFQVDLALRLLDAIDGVA